MLKYLFTFSGEADKEFQAIIALIHEVEGFAKQYNVPGANINPYTNLTGAVSFVYVYFTEFVYIFDVWQFQKNVDVFFMNHILNLDQIQFVVDILHT